MKDLPEIRIRTKLPDEAMEEMLGKNITDDQCTILLNKDCRVFMPNGKLLCILRRKAFDSDLIEQSYPTLHLLKSQQTNNRGLASASKRVRLYGGVRTYSKSVSSTIVGAFESKPPYQSCRLTAWTGTETEKFRTLWPLFQAIGEEFKNEVPDRYQAQLDFARKTKPEWVIPGTIFTTVTINNTYATGTHTDKGDLNEGFSNLAVVRRGKYSGGIFGFPQYGVAVDMQDGDLLLMDAHQYHANTPLSLESDDAERVSIVAYFRTKMTACSTAEEEALKATANAVKRTHIEEGAAVQRVK